MPPNESQYYESYGARLRKDGRYDVDFAVFNPSELSDGFFVASKGELEAEGFRFTKKLTKVGDWCDLERVKQAA